MLSSLIGLSRVLASSLLAASFAAPLEWSPNGQWLAYTILDVESTSILHEDWLLPTADAPSSAPAPPARPGGKHRIWTSRFGSTESVLIEESRWPLSSPTWSVDGRSLVFGRFVPASDDADQTLVRGRYEVVVQSGLDQKKVVVVLPELDLEADQLAAIINLKPEISPDGRYLAVPRPGKSPGVVIVGIDQGAVVKTIDGARQPSWAPDGLRLLFVQESEGPTGQAVRVVNILNRDLGSARPLKTDVILLDAPPIWSLDGQSILAVAQPRPDMIRGFQVDLDRISLDAGPSIRMINLESPSPAAQRNRVAPGFPMRRPVIGRVAPPPAPAGPPVLVKSALSLDREQEECVALIEISGQVQALKWCNIRSQRVTKLFHPLDLTIPIGAPSISPDGQTVAFRVEGPGALGLPAFCDLSTETITLIAADGPTRRVWLELLASCAADVLKTRVQPAVGRKPPVLATILPSPTEVAVNNPHQIRLRRLAKVARGLLDQPPPADDRDQTARETAARDELRLFFDYLAGDYKSAGVRLEEVEARTDDPGTRLRWLCLRAQILLGQGEVERARGISEYLGRATRPKLHAIEETPLGPVMTTIADSRADWASELAQTLTADAIGRSRGRLGLEPGEVEGLDPTSAAELDAFNGRLNEAQPRFPFAPDEQGEIGEGFDPARFRGRMLVVPPRPRFEPPPALPDEPNAPILPRL